MIEFGNTLRNARETKGFSIGQIAEMTHLAPTTIQELETENFSRIAAPIYGRGFIKLYCEAVELDPKPLIAEFMDIYNGNRDPAIKERPLQEPAAAAPEEPAECEPPALPDQHSDVPAPVETHDDPITVTAAEPPPSDNLLSSASPSTSDLFQQEPIPDPIVEQTEAAPIRQQPEPSLSRYAAPVRQASPAIDFRAYLRLGILALAALALLAILCVGIRAVYRATTRPSENREPETTPVAAASVEVPKKTAATSDQKKPTPAKATSVDKKTLRTPQKIPALYVD